MLGVDTSKKGTDMTIIRLNKHGYPIRRSSPKWLLVVHAAGLVIAAYAIGFPYA